MNTTLAVALLACLLAGGSPPAAEEPQIVDLYPNPATYGDDGEFVTLWVPRNTSLSDYRLADDYRSVSLPDPAEHSLQESSNDGTCWAGSRVTFSTDAQLTNALTDRTVYEIGDRIRLADNGDRIRLLRNDTTVDEVTYDSAPVAEVFEATGGTWRPLGATERPVITDGEGTVEAFVLPDAPERAVAELERSDERILLAGYTLSSPAVVEALENAHERGVTVEVLVDGKPVGGMSGHSAAALDELERAGVKVSVIAGDRARYRFHHAKYALVDDRALVTTENWKPAGTGGQSSRGWAVVTDQPTVVESLEKTFAGDTGWNDSTPWGEFDDVSLVDAERAGGTHPTRFEPAEFEVEQTTLLHAPDNAEREIRQVVRGAEDSIDVKQFRIGDENFPLLREVIDAAKRGVEVRILLSGAWYVKNENRALKAGLEEIAREKELSLAVRIAEPVDYEKIHAKGLVVDESAVLVGSINWNNNSLRNNREVALLIEGEGIGQYFTEVFDADWEGEGGNSFPLGLLGAVVGGSLLALVGVRCIEFEKASGITAFDQE